MLSTTLEQILVRGTAVRYGILFRKNPSFVNVGGEQLRLPLRHGFKPRTWPSSSGTDATIEAAIAARHYDGFVRERSVQPLVLSRELWTIPYILELASDYVIEILTELDNHFNEIDRDNLSRYVTENPAHLELTTARINSYWNAYYRTTSKKQATSLHPGFRILTAIASL
jgi:hypothetical protein